MLFADKLIELGVSNPKQWLAELTRRTAKPIREKIESDHTLYNVLHVVNGTPLKKTAYEIITLFIGEAEKLEYTVEGIGFTLEKAKAENRPKEEIKKESVIEDIEEQPKIKTGRNKIVNK